MRNKSKSSKVYKYQKFARRRCHNFLLELFVPLASNSIVVCNAVQLFYNSKMLVCPKAPEPYIRTEALPGSYQANKLSRWQARTCISIDIRRTRPQLTPQLQNFNFRGRKIYQWPLGRRYSRQRCAKSHPISALHILTVCSQSIQLICARQNHHNVSRQNMGALGKSFMAIYVARHSREHPT